MKISNDLYYSVRDGICNTKEELHQWIKTYLNIDLPQHTTSENSNSNPIHMIWWCYYNAIHSKHLTKKEAIFIANRSGGKTLCASIVELLMVYHAKRDVVHLGAILAQAERCYDYFQKYFYNQDFSNILAKDPIMKKTILSNGSSLEILPVSLRSVNGPHTPFLCVGAGTNVLVKNDGFVNNGRDRINLTMKKVVDLFNSGKKIEVLSYNLNTKQLEYKPVLRAEKTGHKRRLKIQTGAHKRNTLWCTEDHKIYDIKTGTYKEARLFSVGDEIYQPKRIQSNNLNRNYKYNKIDFKIDKKYYTQEETLQQVLLGSLLGDGGVYGRYENSKRLYYHEGHGESQIDYLKWKKDILKQQIKFYSDILNYSGYTNQSSGLRISGQCSYELSEWKNFRKDINVFKKMLQNLDNLALAVWYMDDGHKRIFNTHNFSYEQHLVLQKIMLDKFGIQTYIKKTKKKYYTLILRTNEDVAKLYCKIKQFMHPTMEYKLNTKTIFNCEVCNEQNYRFNCSNTAKICNACHNEQSLLVKAVKIKNIEFINQKRDVYDITVQDNHNFFAGSVLISNCVDEVDTVQDMRAYRDISGIPTSTHDGKPPIAIEISTRKFATGLVAQNVAAAPKTGVEVFMWNIIDLTQRCPDKKSLTTKIPIYVNFDDLISIPKSEYDLLGRSNKDKFEEREGYEGCLSNCKIFASCLGDLKNQKNDTPFLNTIEYTEKEIISNDADWVNAQLLCRTPSLEGTIYRTYNPKIHIKDYSEMYKIFMGIPWPEKRECEFEDLRQEFQKVGIRPVMGVDFGDHLATLLLVYFDGKDRGYVVKEKTLTGADDAELAFWAKENWHKYQVDMVYADPASPSGIRLLIKSGFTCHQKVDKGVWGGINTVRRFLRIPGTIDRTGVFIHNSCENLIFEMPNYRKRKNKSLDVYMDEPVKKDDHSLDNLRYILHTIYGQKRVNISFAGQEKKPEKGDFNQNNSSKTTRAPIAEEIGSIIGASIEDDSDLYEKDEETGKLIKKKGSGDDDDGEDFNFFF